jgi:hypothetical protein
VPAYADRDLGDVLVWRFVVLVALACSAGEPNCDSAPQGEEQSSEQASAQAEPVPPAPRQLRDARRLIVDMASMQACDALEGRIMAIADDDEPVRGRIWLRGCEARAVRDQLELTFDALVWTWADERSSAMGATFQVQQHVFLDAEATLRTVPQLSYDRSCGYAFLWLRPQSDPTVNVRTIGEVDADPEGAWSHVLGVFARVIGQRPDDRARQEVTEQGDQELEETVDEGFTIFSDLCTSDVGMELGRIDEPPHPRPRPGEAGPATRVSLHAGGLDVHGPISDGRQDMLVSMTVESGGPVHARLVCEDDAARLMNAFSRGEALPDVPVIAEARFQPPTELRGGRRDRCPLYLATVPATDQETVISFTERPVEDDRTALVPRCAGRCMSRG